MRITALAGWTCVACAPSSASTEDSSSETDESSEDGGDGPPACADPPLLPELTPPRIPWRGVGELSIDEHGLSSSLTIPFPAGQRYIALRSLGLDGDPEDDARICHDLLELRLGDGSSLIPLAGGELLDSHQRSWQGPGAGVFVLSNIAAPLPGPDTLELRIQFRDCVLGVAASRERFPGMATRVHVDAAWTPTPTGASSARLAVRMSIAEDSGWGTLADDPDLAALWQVTVNRYAAAGVELELEAEARLPAVGELRYRGDMLALRGLHEHALSCLRRDEDDSRFVPVVLVPCLRFEDPIDSSVATNLGQSTRIPGIFDGQTSPSLVVLAAGACSDASPPEPGLSPERHGLILAHEIGHYLGLHHTDDALGSHLGGTSAERLMNSGIVEDVEADEAFFSAAQTEVLLRHPDLQFE